MAARFEPGAVDAFGSELISETHHITLGNMTDEANPTMWLAFNDEEGVVKKQERVAIKAYTQEMISKFILGQEPLSNFDTLLRVSTKWGLKSFLQHIHRHTTA